MFNIIIVLFMTFATIESTAQAASRPECEEVGMASVYSSREVAAPGQRFNGRALRAAHRTLAFGSDILVTNLENGLSIRVTINDRGPFVRGRIIDLTHAAAEALGIRSMAKVGINCKVPREKRTPVQDILGICFVGVNCVGRPVGVMYYDECMYTRHLVLSWLTQVGGVCFSQY
jgi:rare lipoprotein A